MDQEETVLINKSTPVSTFEISVESSSDVYVSAKTIRKLNFHLLGLCAGICFLAVLDRRNLGFAANDLCNTLRLSHEEYGFGVSLFSVGYIASHVGSNVILKKLGAPIWLSLIVASWGCCAASFALIRTPLHFYILRVLLGLAEGGCFPGVMYYLSLFYPDQHITPSYGILAASTSIALPVSSLIAAGLLKLDGVFGLAGWRYLFLVEGLIPVLFSFVLWRKLPRSPEAATFLTEDEKMWIKETKKQTVNTGLSVFGEVLQVLKNKSFCVLSFATTVVASVQDLLMYWLTLLIHVSLNGDSEKDTETCGSSKKDSTLAVILTAVPFVFGAILCLLLRNSPLLLRNRTATVGMLKGLAGALLASWALTKRVAFTMGFMSLVLAIGSEILGNCFVHGVIVTLFPESLRAIAMGVFSTVISFGTLAGPLIMGKLVHKYGYSCGIVVSGLSMMSASVLFGLVKDPLHRRPLSTVMSFDEGQENHDSE